MNSFFEIALKIWNRMDKRKLKGWCLLLIGLTLLMFCLYHIPNPENSFVADKAEWAVGTLIGFTMVFSGMPGISFNNWNTQRLKFIDFIWVLGSSFTVILGFVAADQQFIGVFKENAELRIESEKKEAVKIFLDVYDRECIRASVIPNNKCQRLEQIKEAHTMNELPNLQLLNLVCAGFNTQIKYSFSQSIDKFKKGCDWVSILYEETQSPVFRDRENIIVWHLYQPVFAFVLIPLVALRISKSIAEVFWKVGSDVAPNRCNKFGKRTDLRR